MGYARSMRGRGCGMEDDIDIFTQRIEVVRQGEIADRHFKPTPVVRPEKLVRPCPRACNNPNMADVISKQPPDQVLADEPGRTGDQHTLSAKHHRRFSRQEPDPQAVPASRLTSPAAPMLGRAPIAEWQGNNASPYPRTGYPNGHGLIRMDDAPRIDPRLLGQALSRPERPPQEANEMDRKIVKWII
jgi:hypothetical protein